MAAVGAVEAAGRVAGMETSLGKLNVSTFVSADCCSFSVVGRSNKVYTPIGLCGEGLSRGRGGRRWDRVLLSSSSPSTSSGLLNRRVSRPTSATLAPVQGLPVGESLLTDVDSWDLEVETPSLVRQCSDLDWRKLVEDLRSEALHGLQSAGERASNLKALEELMTSWIHDRMVYGIETSLAMRGYVSRDLWDFEDAAAELRMQAKLQAAQVLAKEVDSSFDWETDVAELHQRILLQGDAESSTLKPEQRFWQAWAHEQGHLADASNHLTDEALGCTAVNGEETVGNNSEPVVGESSVDPTRKNSSQGKSLFAFGAAVATGLVAEGSWLLDAMADETSPDVAEAAAKAPSWLVPAVLVFPPLSYLLFNLYREKVDPFAKLTDWMFGIAALTIVSNIVMIAVWGVRLY